MFGVEGPSKLPKWGVVVGSGLLYLLDGSGHLYLSAGFSSTPARCQLTSDPGACAADQAFHSDTRARHAANGVARLIDAAVPSGSASILWECTCVKTDALFCSHVVDVAGHAGSSGRATRMRGHTSAACARSAAQPSVQLVASRDHRGQTPAPPLRYL